MKDKILIVKLSEEQDRLLMEKANKAGFVKKSDFVRFSLFIKLNLEDMVKEIHEKVMKNDK